MKVEIKQTIKRKCTDSFPSTIMFSEQFYMYLQFYITNRIADDVSQSSIGYDELSQLLPEPNVFFTCQEIMINFVVLVWFMVFNATFNNNSIILRRSVLLVEETSTLRKSPTFLKSLTNFIT